MKTLAFLLLATSITDFGVAQDSVITFKGHRIGETAQQFYSIAKVAEGNQPLALDYCRAFLSNATVIQAEEKAKKDAAFAEKLDSTTDDGACHRVLAALDGKDVRIGNRFAYEFGEEGGFVVFHSGRLVVVEFGSKSSYDDVVADMTKKLGPVGAQSQDVYENAFGAKLKGRNVGWSVAGLNAAVIEQRSFQGGDGNVNILVQDSAFAAQTTKQREATRPNSLD